MLLLLDSPKLVEGILFKAAEEKVEARLHPTIDVKHLDIDEISSAKGQGNHALAIGNQPHASVHANVFTITPVTV
ncbi:MAG: hypothetical protein HC802_16525 [Caldilineaceae bacterium]|nr:hypothetical protein [Caldilineaceae bacterium]